MKEKGIASTTMIVIAVVVVIAVVGVAAVLLMGTGGTSEVKHVTLQLDWLPEGFHLQYYAAKEKFWPAKGLDVSIVRGAGSGDTARKVGQGVAEFGVAGVDAGVYVRAVELLPIKSIGSSMLQTDAGYIWVRDRDAGRGAIDSNDLTTLEGKILGDPEWSITTLQLPAVEEALGIPLGGIVTVHMDPAATTPALIKGDCDIQGTTVGEIPRLVDTLQEEGMEADYFLTKDVGVTLLGDAIWTTDRMIANDPETVRKFVEGLQEGLVWTLQNVDEAATILGNNVTGWKGIEDVAAGDFIDTYRNTFPDISMWKEHGILYVPLDLIEGSLASTYVIYSIETDFQLSSASEIYTGEFVNPSIVPVSYPW